MASKNKVKEVQTDHLKKTSKKVFFGFLLAVAFFAGMMIAQLALTAKMLGRMDYIENTLRTTREEFEAYIKENKKSLEDVNSQLDALDYTRLNDAFAKLDKMDSIDIEKLEEALTRINNTDTELWTQGLNNMNRADLGELHEKIVEIEKGVSEISELTAPVQTVAEGIAQLQDGINTILNVLSSIMNPFGGNR